MIIVNIKLSQHSALDEKTLPTKTAASLINTARKPGLSNALAVVRVVSRSGLALIHELVSSMNVVADIRTPTFAVSRSMVVTTRPCPRSEITALRRLGHG